MLHDSELSINIQLLGRFITLTNINMSNLKYLLIKLEPKIYAKNKSTVVIKLTIQGQNNGLR